MCAYRGHSTMQMLAQDEVEVHDLELRGMVRMGNRGEMDIILGGIERDDGVDELGEVGIVRGDYDDIDIGAESDDNLSSKTGSKLGHRAASVDSQGLRADSLEEN